MDADSREHVDACAFHEWPASPALLPYMDEAWKELVAPTGAGFAVNTHGQRMMADPRRGAPIPQWEPATGAHDTTFRNVGGLGDGAVPGSSYEVLRDEVLEPGGADRVVLGYDLGLAGTALAHRYFARDIARAANDWTAEQWLARDERLYGMILVSAAIPEEAAAEIRRAGENERMVAVALGCNVLSRGFGEPVYQPILEAAAEMDLPIVLQTGSDNATDIPTPPIAGAVPTTYAEFRAHAGHAVWHHATSLISEGCFKRWPNLKVFVVGAGAAWVAPWLWRMDYWWKIGGSAIPWVDRLPSEYLVDHFRISTHTLEAPPEPARLAQALGVVKGMDEVLMYSSCFPDSDWEQPRSIAARLPEAWHDRVFRENAMEFYRWPDRSGHVRRESALEQSV